MHLSEINSSKSTKKKIPNDAPCVDIPPANQMDSVSCGVAALRAIFKLFGVDVKNENTLKDELDTTDQGTLPQSIVKIAKKYGLHAKLIDNMSFKELYSYIDKDIPVICAIQAWRYLLFGRHHYHRKVTEGHGRSRKAS